MAYASVNRLVAAGLVAPPPFRQGVLGLGALAGSKGAFASAQSSGQAEVATSVRAYETAYTQIRALVAQLQQAANEARAAAAGVQDPEVQALVDDAQLLATDASDRASEVDKIYALDESWVQDLGSGIHGGWAFGRDIVVNGAKGPNGQPLLPWNRNQILKAAAGALQKIQADLARQIGQIRGARAAIQTKAQNFQRSEQLRVAAEQRAAAEEARVQQAQEAARIREETRQAQADAAEERRRAAAEALEERKIAMQTQLEEARIAAEQRRLEAELQKESQRAQLEQQALQSELQAQQQRLAQQQAAEAAQQAAQLQAQQYQQQLEAQRAAALMQAEMAKLQPPSPPMYGSGALSVPGYGVPQGVMPQPMVPPSFPGYQQAADWGAYVTPPSYSGPGAPAAVAPPQAASWDPSGELFGLRGLGASVLDSVGSFAKAVGPSVADVVAAARGGRPAPAPVQQDSGGGVETLVGVGVAVGVGYFLWKKLGKGGKRSRRRR